MWATIGSIVTAILPLLIKAILAIIEKSDKNKELKEEFLKFIAAIETDVPVKLHARYNDQIARLKEKISQEQVAVDSIESAYNNYRDGYEDILKKYEALLNERESEKRITPSGPTEC